MSDYYPEIPDYDDEDGQPIDPFQQFLEDNGIASIDEIIVDLDNVPNDFELRGRRFQTLREAIEFLIEAGLITFSNIVLIDDLYAVAIADDTDKYRRPIA